MDNSFKDSIKKGFSACKSDIESLNEENNILKDKIQDLESNNTKLESELNSIKSQLENITNLIQDLKNQKKEPISETVTVEIPPKSELQTPIQVKNQKIKEEIKDPYEALLAFKAKTNKRELLKNKIVSMINENGINLSELKFMFVEHYKYCSKATFYNYLKELELERIIKIERENSKNFVYLYSIKREI